MNVCNHFLVDLHLTGTHLRVKVCMTVSTGVANTGGMRPPPLGMGRRVKGGAPQNLMGGT